MYNLVILHNCTIMYNMCTSLGRMYLYFSPWSMLFWGESCASGMRQKVGLSRHWKWQKKILAMINFKKKAQKDVMHILNSMKLSFSGHRVSVFSLRMSSQYYLGLYGKNDNHFSFFNLYHHLMISFTHWKNKLVTYYKNEVTEYEEM